MREFCWKNRFEGEGFIEEQEKNIKQCIFYVSINLLTNYSKNLPKGTSLTSSELIFDLFSQRRCQQKIVGRK